MYHMTDYFKAKIFNDNLRNKDVYVSLFSGNSEVNQASYKRQKATYGEPVEGQIVNSEDIVFPIAKESWGDITHIGIHDAATGGNLLYRSPAEFVKTIDVSSQYKIPKNYQIVRMR